MPELPNLETELVQAARGAPEGDTRAFEQLVLLYQRRIVANCRQLTRDESTSEDLAQEVFVKAYFSLQDFEGRSSFQHWLRRIKVNHCLNHVKKHGGWTEMEIGEPAIQSEPRMTVAPEAERNLEAEVRRDRIRRVLGSMPFPLRVALILRDMDEFSYDEVAAALGIGLSAAKMRIKRAREEFRRRYVAQTAGDAG